MSAFEPAFVADPLVEEAATRAFADLAADPRSTPASIEDAVRRLGFLDALPEPDGREAWMAAAPVIRAQARAAAPLDMAARLAGKSGTPVAREALCLGRCVQIEAALELSLRYVQERSQFGQPLARFQAIQHGLAVAAEEIAACAALADQALACAAREGLAAPRMAPLLDSLALVASRAVDVAYDVLHQVHGAIGYTREYALHRHSLQLLDWRDGLLAARGGEIAVAERLGAGALAAGSAWRAVTALMTRGESP
jgi:hypothetical protein